MKIRKTVTPAKVAANQKNSRKSTGPKSARGKWFASKNATQHGILSRDLRLPGESHIEFEHLSRELITDLAPVGSDEFIQVKIYFASWWRLQRVWRAEAGESAKQLNEFNPRAEIATSEHTRPYRRAVTELKHLEKIEEQISLQALVSAENLDWLRKLSYGETLNDFVRMIELVRDGKSREERSPGQEIPPAAESRMPGSARSADTPPDDGGLTRDLLLNSLESLKNTIRQEILYHGEYLPRRVEAKRNSLHVPQEAVLNRLMRYENHLMNNMYRAQHNLERMQRLRRGEEVPPPAVRVT